MEAINVNYLHSEIAGEQYLSSVFREAPTGLLKMDEISNLEAICN